jgi:hypothetical protein
LNDASQIYCLQCDYDLRGLAESGNCPECGLSISGSIQGRLLRFTDRESLATLHSALLFLMVGTGLWTAYEIARALLAFSAPLLSVLAMLPMIAGLRWISIADAKAEKPWGRIIRKLVRAYAILAAARCLYQLGAGAFVSSFGLQILLVINSFFFLLLYAGQMVLMLRLKTLAERLPSAKLAPFALQLAVLAAVVLLAATGWRVLYDVQVDAAIQGHRLHLLWMPTWPLPAIRWALFSLNALSILLMRGLCRRVDQQIQLVDPADTPSEQRERAIP